MPQDGGTADGAANDPENATKPELTPTEREMLKFSPIYFEYAGEREQAILDRFGMSATSYALALVRLIDRHEAEAFDPLEVRRLRRIRDARRDGL